MEEIKELIAQLSSKSSELRNKAIAKICEAENPEHIPYLIHACDSEDSALKYYAKKALSALRARLKLKGINIDSQIRNYFIEKQIKILKSDNTREKFKAIELLAKYDAREKIEEIVECLNNETDKKLIASLVKLVGKLGSSKVINTLTEYLAHEDNRIRANTVEALENIEAEEICHLLLPMLQDKNSRVKANAAKALWCYTKYEAMSKLKDMLRSDNKEEIKSAIFALSQTGDPDARTLLLKLLNHSDIEIRLKASEAVNIIEDKIAKGDYKPKKKSILDKTFSKEKIIKTEIKNLQSKNYITRLKACEVLGNFGDKEVFSLLLNFYAGEKNEYVLATLAKVLGKLGAKFAPDASINILKELLKHPDKRVVANTIEGIGYIHKGEIFETLVPFLKDKNTRVRANAAKVLYNLKKAKVLKLLNEMLKEGDAWEKESAIYVLEQIGTSEAVELLSQVLKQEDKALSKSATLSISKIEKKELQKTEPILEQLLTSEEIPKFLIEEQIQLLNSSEPKERLKAAQILGYLAQPEIVPVLLNHLSKEEDNFVVASLVKTIGQLGDESVLPALKPYLSHNDARVRANTVEALEFIDSPQITEMLKPLLYDKDNRVKANAIKILFHYKPEIAIQKIKEMAKSPEPWVRISAVYSLSAIANESAYKILKILSNDHDIDVALAATEAKEKLIKKLQTLKIREQSLKYLEIDSLSKTEIEKNRTFLIKQLIEFLKDKDMQIRKKAAISLQKLITDETINILKESLIHETNPFIRALLVKSVTGRKGENVRNFLKIAMGDKDARVRANAVEVFSDLATNEDIGILKPLLFDNDSRVAANTAKLIYKFDKTLGLQGLKTLLERGTESAKISAEFAVVEIGTKEAHALLNEYKLNKDKIIEPKTSKSASPKEDTEVKPAPIIQKCEKEEKEKSESQKSMDIKDKDEIKKSAPEPVHTKKPFLLKNFLIISGSALIILLAISLYNKPQQKSNSKSDFKEKPTFTTPSTISTEAGLAQKQNEELSDAIKFYKSQLYKASIEILLKLKEKSPRNFKILKYLGLCYKKQKKYTLALMFLNTAQKYNKTDKELLKAIKEIKDTLQNQSKKLAARHKNEAKKIESLLKKEKKQKDSTELKNKKSLNIPPVVPINLIKTPILPVKLKAKLTNLETKGVTLFAQNEVGKARDLFLKALKMYKYSLKSNYYMGLINYDKKNYKQAESYFKNALKTKADHFDSIYMLASIYEKTNKLEKALKLLQKCETLKSEDYTTTVALGRLYLKLKKIDLSEKYYKKALKIKEEIETLMGLGKVKLLKGKLPEATLLFNKIIDKFPDSPYGYLGLAKIFYKRKDYEQAIENLKKAIAIENNLWEAHKFLGLIYIKERRLSRAKEHLKKAIALKPNDAEINFALGNVYNLIGMTLNAISQYQQAIKLKSDFIEAYVNLGDCLATKSYFSDALETYIKALKLNPSPSLKELINKKIQSVEQNEQVYESPGEILDID